MNVFEVTKILLVIDKVTDDVHFFNQILRQVVCDSILLAVLKNEDPEVGDVFAFVQLSNEVCVLLP